MCLLLTTGFIVPDCPWLTLILTLFFLFFFTYCYFSKECATLNTESTTTFRATVLFYSDKESMFSRERPPGAGKNPNDRASPPHQTPLQLVSSFCCFPTTVYMQPGSLFISWERRSRPLCTLPLRCVYQLGLCLSTALPCLPSFTGREFQAPSHDTRLAIVCGVHCLQFPQCPFVVYHHQAKSNDTARPRLSLLIASVLSALAFPFLSHVNEYYVFH